MVIHYRDIVTVRAIDVWSFITEILSQCEPWSKATHEIQGPHVHVRVFDLIVQSYKRNARRTDNMAEVKICMWE